VARRETGEIEDHTMIREFGSHNKLVMRMVSRLGINACCRAQCKRGRSNNNFLTK